MSITVHHMVERYWQTIVTARQIVYKTQEAPFSHAQYSCYFYHLKSGDLISPHGGLLIPENAQVDLPDCLFVRAVRQLVPVCKWKHIHHATAS